MKNNPNLAQIKANKELSSVVEESMPMMMDESMPDYMMTMDESGRYSAKSVREMIRKTLMLVDKYLDKLPENVVSAIGRDIGGILMLLQTNASVEEASPNNEIKMLLSNLIQTVGKCGAMHPKTYSNLKRDLQTIIGYMGGDMARADVEEVTAGVKPGDKVMVKRKGAKNKDRKGTVKKVYKDDGVMVADVELKGQGIMPIQVSQLEVAK
ncbi:hypothetical protein GR7B_00062 [Vibrio phage vB_VcorM_GR7B]|nr:hypothetical protein GR7B_00062 [Vibrio phage vB_VcorM_GR7B]